MKQKIAILGSTGGLGQLAMELLKKGKSDFVEVRNPELSELVNKEHFQVVGISANKNEKSLKQQAREFKITNTAIYSKNEKLDIEEADIVINVLSGVGGISPSLEALKKNKTLLLANKESIVAEGLSLSNHKNMIPLDSEHNAIFEIIKSHPRGEIEAIYIPCSGGPFYERENLNNITVEEATTHPRWKMGKKISVESATLINKGLEIIEAHHLFSLPISKIKAFHHPKCEIHGIVKFRDRTLAYFSPPDMKNHIENALLRAGGLTPSPDIRQVDFEAMILSPPANPHLRGIEIVLNFFKKSPHKMRYFLEAEEEIINRFLHGEIEFREITELLSKL